MVNTEIIRRTKGMKTERSSTMSMCPICTKFACAEHFDIWWNAQNFNWENDSWALAKFCYAHFDKWWDENKFNWQDASWALSKYCHMYFDKWWNPERYDWFLASAELVCYCYMHFDKWWDADRFHFGHAARVALMKMLYVIFR